MSELVIPDRDEWLAWRRGGIGGSDAAVILGLDAFRTPVELWLDKLGELPDETSEAMELGKALEPVIAERFEKKTGLVVNSRQLCVTHREFPWMRATIDGLVIDPELCLYEAKATSGWSWREGTPDYVQIQIQHSLEVCNLGKCYLAVLRGDRMALQVEEIARDREVGRMLIEAEGAFWTRYVVPRVSPPAIGVPSEIEALKEAYAESNPESVDLGDDGASLVLDMRRAQLAKKEAEREETRAKAGLMALLGKAELGSVNGEIAASWKAVETSRLDQKRLKEERPEVVEAYSSVSLSRRFSLVNEGKEI
jgi:putative phage-type endonuclease